MKRTNMNDAKQSFKELVKTCLHEVKEERVKKEKLREALKKYVKTVLSEVIAGPQPIEQDKDDETKIQRGYDEKGNEPSKETQDQQVQELTKIVHGINADFNVYRENEGVTGAYTSGKRSFIIIDGGELHSIRIKERWENNFDIEEFIREQDRVIALGLNWPQVKAFVKANVGEISKTYVQGAKDKVDKNREDQTPSRDSDLPDTTKGIKTTKLSNDKAKPGQTDAEDQVKKKEDQPDQPMKAVTKPGENPKSMNKAKDQKETDKVKPPKHKNDDELVKRMPGKKKDKGD